MRIVVNHLTRMQHGYICVAGIDPTTGKHVRPQPEDDRWRRPDLVRQGGPFDIASVVDLGRSSYIGRAPELEDYRVRPTNARRQMDLTATEFWELLMRVSCARLREIFGDDLHRQGTSFAVDEGKGKASLGCLLLSRPPALRVTAAHDVRLSFSTALDAPALKVTDLRLYEGNPVTVRREVVQSITRRIADGVTVILSVGLGRPWQKPGDVAPRHWLQVNNIHLEDDPLCLERSLPH